MLEKVVLLDFSLEVFDASLVLIRRSATSWRQGRWFFISTGLELAVNFSEVVYGLRRVLF